MDIDPRCGQAKACCDHAGCSTLRHVRMKLWLGLLERPVERDRADPEDHFVVGSAIAVKADHDSSPQLGPETASTRPVRGASGNRRTKAASMAVAMRALISE